MKTPDAPASIIATTEGEIALRAYQIWQAAGCPAGQADAHWDQAVLDRQQREREPEATFEETPLAAPGPGGERGL